MRASRQIPGLLYFSLAPETIRIQTQSLPPASSLTHTHDRELRTIFQAAARCFGACPQPDPLRASLHVGPRNIAVHSTSRPLCMPANGTRPLQYPSRPTNPLLIKQRQQDGLLSFTTSTPCWALMTVTPTRLNARLYGCFTNPPIRSADCRRAVATSYSCRQRHGAPQTLVRPVS